MEKPDAPSKEPPAHSMFINREAANKNSQKTSHRVICCKLILFAVPFFVWDPK